MRPDEIKKLGKILTDHHKNGTKIPLPFIDIYNKFHQKISVNNQTIFE